jgi:hypothetical protein
MMGHTCNPVTTWELEVGRLQPKASRGKSVRLHLNKEKKAKVKGVAQVAELLPRKAEALNSKSCTMKKKKDSD